MYQCPETLAAACKTDFVCRNSPSFLKATIRAQQRDFISKNRVLGNFAEAFQLSHIKLSEKIVYL